MRERSISQGMLRQVQKCLYLGMQAAQSLAQGITAALNQQIYHLLCKVCLPMLCKCHSYFVCVSIGLKTVGMRMQLDGNPENAVRADPRQIDTSQILQTAGFKFRSKPTVLP